MFATSYTIFRERIAPENWMRYKWNAFTLRSFGDLVIGYLYLHCFYYATGTAKKWCKFKAKPS